MKMKNFVAAVLAGGMALSLVACGGSASSSTASSSDATAESAETSEATSTGVTVQIGPNPETLDPALNSAIDGANILITNFETLLIVGENNEILPGQAESWEVSDDGLVWTFHLRDGLKWSDGSDLTAHDFEYSFKRVADPATAAPYAEAAVGMIAGYDEAAAGDTDALQVEATDDTTLVVTLAYPCTYFDKLAAFATLSPVQQATVEANGDGWCTSPETYVSNGPYMITEWTPSERIVMTKNPYYKGGWDSSKIVSDTITFLLLEDSSAAYAAYNSGEAQLVKDVPTEEIPSLTSVDDGGDFYVDPIMGTYYLSLNIGDNGPEVFKDVRVRKALSLAIDREYVANEIMQGTYSPAYNFIGPGITDADGTTPFMDVANGGEGYISDDYAANLEEAKQLLADAGYPNGDGFPTITYSTNDAGYHVAVAEYLQQAYAELGITLEINKMEWSSFTPARRAGEFEMARNGWVFDYNDPSSQLDLLTTGNGNNDGKFSNEEYDAAMAATQTADVDARFQALHEAEDIAMDQVAMIPLAYYNDFWLQNSSLKGTWHSAYGYWYLQYAYVEE